MNIDLNLIPAVQWILATSLVIYMVISFILLPLSIKKKRLEIELLKEKIQNERRKNMPSFE